LRAVRILRAVISPAEIRMMQTVAQEVFRTHPEIVDATMGELAYQSGIGNFNLDERSACRVWSRGGRPVAYAIFWPPSSLDCWQVHPDHPEPLDEILDWFQSLAETGVPARAQARDGDPEASGGAIISPFDRFA
jgi:hypothetical protein